MTTLIVAFFLAQNTYAAVQITEVMYDVSGTDTNREWIEIYNQDATAVDVTKLKLFEANTNHGITASIGGDVLNSGAYAVIADKPESFKLDFPNYIGLIYDSTFSLSNTGEILALKAADGSTLDSTTYDISNGAGGDGNSLQKINNAWVASAPTPGTENIFSQPQATSTNNTNTGNSTTTATTTSPTGSTVVVRTSTVTQYVSVHSSPEDLSDYQENPALTLSAGRERIVYVGTPLELYANYKVSKGLEWVSCTFDWSYGDGLQGTGQQVVHTYKYAGDYSVVVNGTCGDKKSVSRTKVKVLIPRVSIISSADGDIEIFNNANSEINIGLWKLKDGVHTFVISQDTIIAPLRSIVLSVEDTKLDIAASSSISLYNPTNKEVAVVHDMQRFVGATSSIQNRINNSQISVEKAEVLVLTYKNTLAHKENRIAPISTTSKLTIEKTASALEAIQTSGTEGLLSRVLGTPARAIGRFFHSFYNF